MSFDFSWNFPQGDESDIQAQCTVLSYLHICEMMYFTASLGPVALTLVMYEAKPTGLDQICNSSVEPHITSNSCYPNSFLPGFFAHNYTPSNSSSLPPQIPLFVALFNSAIDSLWREVPGGCEWV